MLLQELVEDQVFSPTLIAGALRTTKSEIASTLGLGRDAFSRASRVRARKTQTRLREMNESWCSLHLSRWRIPSL